MGAEIIQAAPRAVPYTATSFEACRLSDGSKRAYPISFERAPSDLKEAVTAAKVHCFHKDKLFVKETNERGSTLHIYAVKKKSQPTKVYANYAYHNVYPLYEELICSLDPSAYDLLVNGAGPEAA